MSTAKICPQCRTPLPINARAGLCPRCVMEMNLATHTDFTGETGPHGTKDLAPVPSPEELAARFPQLEILELLGRGGMGAVYKARQKELDRIVALKILPPGTVDQPAFAERFSREAKALAKLNHPNIVTLYEFGRAEGLFFFLMEYVDGVNLRQLLGTERVSSREALAIVPQICDALQYAHDHGIVHRDIKPENILMDRRGRVKVADFGIARLVAVGKEASDENRAPVLAPSLTEAGKIVGTPQYMAPEQMEKPTEVDHRADIYAVGVVFYQMLTGELPGHRIEAPSKKVHVDVRLDEIVLRALEQKPELRYQTAEELKTRVENISTSPASPKPKDSKTATLSSSWTQRHHGMPKLLWLPLCLLTLGVVAKLMLRLSRGSYGAAEIILPMLLVLGLWFRSRLAYVITVVVGLYMPSAANLEPRLAAVALALTAAIVLPVLSSTRWFLPLEMPTVRRRAWIGSTVFLGCLSLVIGLAVPPERIVSLITPRSRINSHPTGSANKTSALTPEAEKAKADFGPVIERVLLDPDHGSGKGNRESLHLATGEQTSLLDNAPKDQGGRLRALAASPCDLFAEYDDFVSGEWALMTCGMKLSDFPARGWDTATVRDLKEALKVSTVIQHVEHSGATLYQLPKNFVPITLAIETRDGAVGLLQITAFEESPRSLRIRYKLQQNASAGDSGSFAGFAFGPVMEQLVEETIDFDSGKLGKFPESSPSQSIAQTVLNSFAWMDREGMDGAVETTHSFLGVGMKVAALDLAKWETFTPRDVEKILLDILPVTSIALTSTNVYAFETREGAKGLLQLISFSDEGVRVKYKLVKGSSAESSATRLQSTFTIPHRPKLGQAALEAARDFITEHQWKLNGESGSVQNGSETVTISGTDLMGKRVRFEDSTGADGRSKLTVSVEADGEFSAERIGIAIARRLKLATGWNDVGEETSSRPK